MFNFVDAARITGGKILLLQQDKPIRHLFTDSRKPVFADGAVFMAIKGLHHNGHDYLQNLYNNGMRQFIVEQPVALDKLPAANVLLVPGCVDALQALARWHRKSFNLEVIGVTGSNAKTIVKEWLYQVLSPDISIVKNPGSYNSQLGVPLSVLQIQTQHRLGIFEAGISTINEMQRLADIIQPTLGVFTNIGPSHDEGFANTREKILEKLKLFSQVRKLVYCADHLLIHEELKHASIATCSWGASADANIQVVATGKRKYEITYQCSRFNLELPFDDKASVENAMHVVATMMVLGYEPARIQERLRVLRSIPMRLKLREGINGCYVIDDSYNNDLSGLRISLDFLAGQHQKKRKILILSDILQSGLDDVLLVTRIAELVNNSGVDTIIGIGKQMQQHASFFTMPSQFFADTDAFLHNIRLDDFHDAIILLKGARRFRFEKILAVLQRKVHGTVMEINLDAMVHNLNYFRSLLLPSTKMMVMVKAFAYGSGSAEVANLLQYHKVDYLGVAYADEGIELRKHNITVPILVMNPTAESFSSIQHYQLEPEIYSLKILHSLIDFLKGAKARIHLKIDTGMHRLGFDGAQVEELIHLLVATPNVQVASIFSHLSGADDPAHDDFTRTQAQRFTQVAEQIADAIGYKPLLHILNSPGLLRHTQWQLDMVRLGIGLYGIDPTSGQHPLRPVATLKTVVSQIREIAAGETIGYGRKGKANAGMRVATIALGYADGFGRVFSNGVGKVLVNGKLAPVVGNVCMDMTMIDVTGIEVQEGDEVIIFGDDLPIADVAQWANTIPYEILTNTSERVKRVFVAESI